MLDILKGPLKLQNLSHRLFLKFIFIFCFMVFSLCEGVRSLGTGVTDRCEPPCGCWDLNLHPREEHPVFFTAESYL